MSDTGTAYGRPPAHYNAALTEVGAGTPMGEFMRRYWQPVALAAEATDLPREIRVLGEDLILFRDKHGRPGLVYPRCAHRGTSLLYGRVEEEGIRCCYHGWLFDVQGRCLDQPCEPEGGLHRDKVRQPWYPVQDLYGLVWAYMGPPEKKPLLPRYETLETLGESEQLFVDGDSIGSVCEQAIVPFNWLQHYENVHDMGHFYWLHNLHSGPQFGDAFGPIDKADVPALSGAVEYQSVPQGVVSVTLHKVPGGEMCIRHVIETHFPTVRIVPTPVNGVGPVDQIAWVLPVDDTHFRIFTVMRAKERTFFDISHQMVDHRRGMSLSERQRNPHDMEAQGGQGLISLHSEEHLASSDRGVVLLRRAFQRQLDAMAQGKDPANLIYDPAQQVVRLDAGFYPVMPADAPALG